MEGRGSSLFMGVDNNLSSPAPLIMVSSYPNYPNIPSPILQRHQAEAEAEAEAEAAAMSAEELHCRHKIISHPYFPRLLAAYLKCQKIGAPAEMSARLEEACAGAAAMRGGVGLESRVRDPALDQFMEAYCEMLIKYEQELSKPFTEATLFLATIHRHFQALTISHHTAGEAEDEVVVKGQLLEKYGGSLGKLKQELMSKKKKNGKLPKEGRQELVKWWSRHTKWPYPSEADKMALAQSTGLDQRQINNWFINQRKRHWKPPPPSCFSS